MLRAGIDIGSTTAKLILVDELQQVVHSTYCRHNAQIQQTLSAILNEALSALGDCDLQVCITGSAGMGIAERTGIPFIQEAVSSAEVIRQCYPEVRTLIDVGGEDTKLIFFDERKRPDIRMNGNCAGGTGAFIDQMATLLNVSIKQLDSLSANHQHLYPIASRCGVFAKTDVQNLISRQISKEDISATILHAVALQTKNTLARGSHIAPKALFCGGPLTFLPTLREAFLEIFQLTHEDVILPDRSEMFPALGAALSPGQESLCTMTISELARRVEPVRTRENGCGTLAPLFKDEQEFREWQEARAAETVGRVDLRKLKNAPCYLGVDSGSTTTKIVLIDDNGSVAYEYYANNKGNPIRVLKAGISRLQQLAGEAGVDITISRSAATGYGEDLIRAAFALDEGIVETLAHRRAAQELHKDVSFILDIGGQDMKAIFIQDGCIKDIAINEACSSGCGSFIETFSESLGHCVSDFAAGACNAQNPCDLGSRCTVFMNSRVKQALREGSTIPDIAAGLAYSVAKNCLQKVLKIHDTAVLGDVVVVQGGTFRNAAVYRAFEKLLGRKVLSSGIPELMGAYGAALTARDSSRLLKAEPAGAALSGFADVAEASRRPSTCHGCENNCRITTIIFRNGQRFFTGNKCEKLFSNRGKECERGHNIAERQRRLLFDRPLAPTGPPKYRIGIPRVLNMYEDFPFWCTLFVESGMAVQLSPISTHSLCDSGCGTVMSDNICFPAKLVHGHIQDLLSSGVDRIFYPMVFFETGEPGCSSNSWNCPIVAAYPDVIRSAIDPEGRHGIPFDTPTVTLRDESLLRESCYAYLNTLGVNPRTSERAFRKAIRAQRFYKDSLRSEALAVVAESEATRTPLVVIAARPYHLDPLINHKIPEVIADLGVNVITADALPVSSAVKPGEIQVLAQWGYPNRLYDAARWVASHNTAELIHLNSFGCGPDSVTIEEVKSILTEHGKNHTLLRIDEVTSPGSVRLRIRSLIESVRLNRNGVRHKSKTRPTSPTFQREDKRRTILVPHFSPFYSAFIAGPLEARGYSVETLPPTDGVSAELGLKYTNNEICYPAILVIGDFIKALRSGKYRIPDVAVSLTQTGGQCRASNYAPLVKKALVSAGFADIPVITISTSNQNQNDQPGFSLNLRQVLRSGFWGVVFGDSMSQMYFSTAVREQHKGDAAGLVSRYTSLAAPMTQDHNVDGILALLNSAVTQFNLIPVCAGTLPQIGIVGEIYVKYNDYCNNFIIKWLQDQGVEVEIPPMIDFFIQGFVNVQSDRTLHLARENVTTLLAFLGEKLVRTRLDRVNAILQRYVRYEQQPTIHDLARKASHILSLADQFGEGWLIPAEVSALAEHGVNNILCLQPFGCIANHIVAKGVEKRMRDLFPQLNLLYLDMDAGAGEANLLNRLHFMVQGARECAA